MLNGGMVELSMTEGLGWKAMLNGGMVELFMTEGLGVKAMLNGGMMGTGAMMIDLL